MNLLLDANFQPILRVAVTSRALFDLEAEDKVFREEGLAAYKLLQRKLEHEQPKWGTAYPLIRKLVAMTSEAGAPLVEVVLASRNDPITALRIARAIEATGLPILRRAYSGGRPLHGYLRAFGVDLFLSAHEEDVRAATAKGFAAALVLPSKRTWDEDDLELRVALDGDSSIFSDESDQYYREVGGDLDAFHERERDLSHVPMERGPLAPFLEGLQRLKDAGAPIRTALVTARCAPADQRPIRTLERWGIFMDEYLALGGLPKAPFLDGAFDIFFDDSERFTEQSREVVPTSRILPPAKP